MVRIGLLSALKRELPEVIPYGKSKYVQTYNIGNYDIGVLLSVLSHLIQNMVFSIKPSTTQNHKPLIFNKTFFD